jgi:hypothetical protein
MGGTGDGDCGWRIERGEREREERKSKNTNGRCEYKRRVPEYARCSFGKGSARARPASATATACGVLGGLLVGLPARRRISRHSSDIFVHIDSTLAIGVARVELSSFTAYLLPKKRRLSSHNVSRTRLTATRRPLPARHPFPAHIRHFVAQRAITHGPSFSFLPPNTH